MAVYDIDYQQCVLVLCLICWSWYCNGLGLERAGLVLFLVLLQLLLTTTLLIFASAHGNEHHNKFVSVL